MALIRKEFGSGHTYMLDIPKGSRPGRVPGVTSCVGYASNSNGLVYAAAKLTAQCSRDAFDLVGKMDDQSAVEYMTKAHRREWDAAATRGTTVHRWLEYTLRGDELPDEIEINKQVVRFSDYPGYIDQAKRFLDTWQPDPVVIEGVCGNRQYAYAGTCDLVCDMGGVRTLLDFKTVAPDKEPQPYPTVALQLAGYKFSEFYTVSTDLEYCEHNTKSLGIEKTVAVVMSNGDFNVVPLNASNAEFRYFLHSIQMWRFDKDHYKTVVGAAIERPEDYEDAA